MSRSSVLNPRPSLEAISLFLFPDLPLSPSTPPSATTTAAAVSRSNVSSSHRQRADTTMPKLQKKCQGRHSTQYYMRYCNAKTTTTTKLRAPPKTLLFSAGRPRVDGIAQSFSGIPGRVERFLKAKEGFFDGAPRNRCLEKIEARSPKKTRTVTGGRL